VTLQSADSELSSSADPEVASLSRPSLTLCTDCGLLTQSRPPAITFSGQYEIGKPGDCVLLFDGHSTRCMNLDDGSAVNGLLLLFVPFRQAFSWSA